MYRSRELGGTVTVNNDNDGDDVDELNLFCKVEYVFINLLFN